MTISEAAEQLLAILVKKREAGISEEDLAYTESSMCIGVARVGHDSQAIVVCKLEEMIEQDIGGPLHSLVLPSKKLHPLELEYLNTVIKV